MVEDAEAHLPFSPLPPWSVHALNLAEHADNIVHTDEGARAAGYAAALVAGTTVYAYLTHVPAAGWGRAWVDGGGAEVRFRSPVFDNDLVECVDNDGVVEALVGGELRATLALQQVGDQPGPQVGERLPDQTFRLDEQLAGYGTRAGDTLELYANDGIAHPAVWPVIGNRVTIINLITGPWIHVRSRISHLGTAPLGEDALVETTLVKRFDSRAGERAILDLRVSVAGQPVAAIEHESIINLA